MASNDNKARRRMRELEDELRQLRAALGLTTESDSDESFHRYFDIGLIGKAIVRPNKEWVAMNDRFCEILGFTREELRAKTWLDITHPDDRASSKEVYAEIVSGKSDEHVWEKRYIRGDGGVVYATIALRGIRNAAGAVERIVVALTDITKLRLTKSALMDARQQMQQVLAVSPAVLYHCGAAPDYPTTFISENVSTQLGYDPAQFYKDPFFWTKQIHPDDVDRVLSELACCSESSHFAYEYRFLHKDGHYIWLHDEVTTIRGPEGSVVGLVGSWFDITLRKEMESELLESRRVMSTLLKNLPGIAYRCKNDQHWTMEFVSEGCVALTGYKSSDLINNKHISFAELIHSDDRERVRQSVQVGLDRRQPFQMNYRIIAAGGQEKWVWEQGVGVFDDSGELRALEGFITDATEQKRSEYALRDVQEDLEERVRQRTNELTTANEQLMHEIAERQQAQRTLAEREALLHAFLDNSQAVVYVKDVDGRYILVNRKYLKIFHLTAADVLGKTDFDIFPIEFAKGFRANDEKVLALMKPVEADEIALQDNVPHTYISLKFPLINAAGEPYAVCGISTDISDRKRAEAAISKAREEAESANRMKSVFLANMSHEIRTPLTAMLASAESLDPADASPEASGRRRRARDILLRNGRHLLSLLNDLLDMARVESGKLSIEMSDSDIVEVVADVVAATGPMHSRPDVRYSVCYGTPIPDTIHTDATRLKQALINLNNNALKFTSEGSVTMRVSAESVGGTPMIRIAVSDTGPGIPEAALEHVFDTFSQLDTPTSEAAAGVGLGLPIARWIVERLGGTLTAKSSAGRGSTFTAQLPVGDHPDLWKQPQDFVVPHHSTDWSIETAVEPKLAGSVLLAEDFPDTRQLIAEALARCGVHVVAVANGRQAVDAAERHAFDLILMDIRMPIMDGCAAAQALRERKCTAAMIALTASTDSADHKRLLKSGFDDVWEKPLEIDTLLDRASDYLHVDCSARGRSGLSSSRMDELIAAYRRALPARVREIAEALKRGDQTYAREELHKIAGSAGVHGLDDVSNAAAKLLSEAKVGKLNAESADFQRLRDRSEQIATERPDVRADDSAYCDDGAAI